MTVRELISRYEEEDNRPFEIEDGCRSNRYYGTDRNLFMDRSVKQFWYEADVDMDGAPTGTLVVEVE